MNPIHILQSYMNAENLQKDTMISLRPGQLVNGRVEKFLPNNMALIQIGNSRLLANIQTSLSTKEHYWFEVRSDGGEGIQLKVVEEEGQSISQRGNQDILKYLQLPQTKTNVQLLQLFLAKNIPFTKEHLTTAEGWMKNNPDISKGLNALELMLKKDLPFTKQTFQALLAVQDSESFSSQLEKLARFLDNPQFSSLKTVQQLKQLLNTLLANGTNLATNGQLDSGSAVKQKLQTMVQSLGLTYENEVEGWATEKQNSLELLQSLKPLLMGASSELGTNVREFSSLNKDQQISVELLQSLKLVLMGASSELGTNAGEFSSLKTDQQIKQLLNTFLSDGNYLAPNDQLGSGSAVKQKLQTIVQSLGLTLENEVQGWTPDKQNSLEFLQSLKPLLMGASAELGTHARELEPLLNRLTGMQFISQDSTGAMQQLLMQLPITLGETKSDVTIQWSGRKRNGQIDPDHCRILFYLELQWLKQTVVDMQIQNKVIHVTVINDTKEIAPIVSDLTPTLKQKLENFGYQLSYIKVFPYEEKKIKNTSLKNPVRLSSEFYDGVDIKI